MPDDAPSIGLSHRLPPAVLTALGVMLVAAGLLGFGGSADAGTASAPSATPDPTPRATVVPTLPPLRTLGPSPTPPPTPEPTANPDHLATRIVIPALQIDMPVMEGPNSYPPCDVAMYFKELGQPGQPRGIYIYAHARKGMFLPLLEQSKVRDGARMLGMVVQVYTDDNRVYSYEITEVRRHQRTLTAAQNATSEELWLQTSEGPNSTYPKLQVVALPLTSGPADPADAQRTPRPRAC